jgi:hypothetical protein
VAVSDVPSGPAQVLRAAAAPVSEIAQQIEDIIGAEEASEGEEAPPMEQTDAVIRRAQQIMSLLQV